MRHIRFSLLLVLALRLGALSLSAQEGEGFDEFDPFDVSAFDTGVQSAVESDDSVSTEFLFGASFVPSAGLTVTDGFEGYIASGNISGKAFAKLSSSDYGSIFIAYSFAQQVLQGRGGDVPAVAVPAKDLFEPSFSLTEFHYSFDFAKTLFVRMGNQLIAWGPSRIWTPVDFINNQKMDSFQAIDLRAGKPGLRLHVPLESSNVFAFADFSGTVASGAVNDLIDTVNLGLRYDIALGGFEFGLGGYGGLDTQVRAGLDFSGRLLGLTAYGEAAVLPGYGSYAFSWSATLGIERTVGQLRKTTLSGELFYNSSGEVDESNYAALVTAKTFSPMYVGKWYAYAGATLDDFLSPDLSTSVSVLANLSDLSYSLRLTESFALRGVPPFSFIVSYAGGGDKKAFTYYSGSNTLSFTLQSRIDF
ncbi:MAG: hypothetical protein RBT72_09545 [Spirochaetia bacterium]|jgi:hypothetical protein|nr:hypothetical protein [Spirochaetia bacterium]